MTHMTQIRFPVQLKEQMKQEAKQLNLSFSTYVVLLLQGELKRKMKGE